MTAPATVDELRQQLVAAAGREARRHRRRPLAAAIGAALAALSALALLVLPSNPAAADVVVRIRHGVIEVTLVDLEHRPERIEAAARRAGLDVTVRAVPVGSSSVGRFVGQDSSGPLPPELVRLHDGPAGFRGFALPEGWAGRLQLLVGRPAADDETWARYSDATAPGEALACRAVVGREAAVVADELADAAVSVRYRVAEDGGVRLLRPTQVIGSRWSSWRVAGADGIRHDEVVIRLVPATDPAAPSPPAPDPRCDG